MAVSWNESIKETGINQLNSIAFSILVHWWPPPNENFSFFFYCCSSTVFCLFLPPSPTLQPFPPPSHFHTPSVNCPCVLYNCSCKPFTLFPWNSLPSPLWSLSACSQFQCLWLYFACLFVLLIRFLLKVRSNGICPSPPGLFRLA